MYLDETQSLNIQSVMSGADGGPLAERLPNFGKEKHLPSRDLDRSQKDLRTITELNQPGMAPKHKSKSIQMTFARQK